MLLCGNLFQYQCEPILSSYHVIREEILKNKIICFQAADQLTHAYKYGSFEKVNEFLNFREKLRTSHHYCRVCIELTINELIHSANYSATVQVNFSSMYMSTQLPIVLKAKNVKFVLPPLCFSRNQRQFEFQFHSLFPHCF